MTTGLGTDAGGNTRAKTRTRRKVQLRLKKQLKDKTLYHSGGYLPTPILHVETISKENSLLLSAFTQTPKENPHLVGIPMIIVGCVASCIEQVQESEEHCASGG